MLPSVAARGASGGGEDPFLDLLLPRLQLPELGLVGAPYGQRVLPGRDVGDDQSPHGHGRGLRLGLQAFHLDEVLRGFAAAGGDDFLRLLDLGLAHGEQDLGGMQVVVCPGLLTDDGVHERQATRDLGRVLRVQERREPEQGRIALLVVVGDRVGDLVALALEVALPLGEIGARDGEPGHGGLQPVLHLLVAEPGRGDLCPGGGKDAACRRRAVRGPPPPSRSPTGTPRSTRRARGRPA